MLVRQRYFGDRAFYREVIAISIPIMLQQLITTLMGFADNVMVGQISADVLAGVTVANKFYMITQSILFGITGGICIFISQYYCAEDHEKVQGLFRLNMFSALALTMVATPSGFILPRAPLGPGSPGEALRAREGHGKHLHRPGAVGGVGVDVRRLPRAGGARGDRRAGAHAGDRNGQDPGCGGLRGRQ